MSLDPISLARSAASIALRAQTGGIDPLSAFSSVSNMLSGMGFNPPFNQLIGLCPDPMKSIGDLLGGILGNQPSPCRGPSGNPGPGGLNTYGNSVVDTGRYLVSAREDQLRIYDKQTNTWTQVDQHGQGTTSDGDRFHLDGNASIKLPDGTEVKMEVTKDAFGNPEMNRAAVIKGNEGVVIGGIDDGQPGVTMAKTGQVFKNAGEVDGLWGQGTVLRAGNQVDDLYRPGGSEIRGTNPFDPSRGWDVGQNRALLSRFPWLGDILKRYAPNGPSATNGTQGTQGTPDTANTGSSSPAPGTTSSPVDDNSDISGGSIEEILFKLLNKAQRKLAEKVDELKNLKAPGDGTGASGGTGSTQAQADFDSQKQTLLIEIQQAQQDVKLIGDAASNVSKTFNEAQSTAVNNLRA